MMIITTIMIGIMIILMSIVMMYDDKNPLTQARHQEAHLSKIIIGIIIVDIMMMRRTMIKCSTQSANTRLVMIMIIIMRRRMEMLYPHRHHHQSIPGKHQHQHQGIPGMHQHQHQGIPGKHQHQHQGIPGMLAAAWVPDQCQTQAKPSEKLRFRQKKLDIILNRQHVEHYSEIAGTWPDHVKY